jgi:alpha-ribazole phosphatase
MELILVRHTTPKVPLGVCYGQLDCELTDQGYAEIENTVKLIKTDLNDDTPIYSSPLKRCQILAQASAKKFKLDHRLKELNFGHWEGQQWQTLKNDSYYQWLENFTQNTIPGGESVQDLFNRVEEFYLELKETHSKAIIITHSGVIRCFLKMALQFPLSRLYTLPLNYGSVSRLALENSKDSLPKIKVYNQTL